MDSPNEGHDLGLYVCLSIVLISDSKMGWARTMDAQRPNYLKFCKQTNRRPDLQAHGLGFELVLARLTFNL